MKQTNLEMMNVVAGALGEICEQVVSHPLIRLPEWSSVQ